MLKRISSIITAALVLGIVVATVCTTNLVQGKRSLSENRVLRTFPVFFDKGGMRSGLLGEINNWFKDNIGFRDFYKQLGNTINFNVFHMSTSPNVQRGKDGWLFYTLDSNLEVADGTYPNFTEEKISRYCKQLTAVQERLKKQGIEFVFAIPPSKASVYPEYIQGINRIAEKSPADLLADYLEKNSSIRVVRFKDALIAEKSKSADLLFYKTDTHWNWSGRYIGYKKLISDFNKWGLIHSPAAEADLYGSVPCAGDLSNMMGPIDLKGTRFSEKDTKLLRIKNPQAKEIKSGEAFEQFRKQAGRISVPERSFYSVNVAKQDEPKILIFGDSMVRGCIINLLAENFSDTKFVWTYRLDQELIDACNPNIVMLDISERGLGWSLLHATDAFLKTEFRLDSKAKVLDIYYRDEGACSQMYFPTWSRSNGQDDLVWYKAERVDADTWHVKADVSHHGSGIYDIHFYDEVDGKRKCVFGTTFTVAETP